MKARSIRAFRVGGTAGFPAQGGHSGGCGVPGAAKSVALSVTTAGATRPGYVTGYPNGATRPTATAVSFTRGVTVTGAADATLRISGAIRAYLGSSGSATFVLDVTGYYLGPLWAEVSSAGNLLAGSRVVAASRIGTGRYVSPSIGTSAVAPTRCSPPTAWAWASRLSRSWAPRPTSRST